MSVFSNVFKGKSRDAPGKEYSTGRVSEASKSTSSVSTYRSRSNNLLEELRSISDEANAIEFIAKKTPDASMALWNFVRLANQGHSVKFYPLNSTKNTPSMTDVEEEWRTFASRINAISNSGLDGLIDILHRNGILFGAQIGEIEVTSDRKDIREVHPIDPRTVRWEAEKRDGIDVWVPYQYGKIGTIDLSKGNIINIPTDPDGNTPVGNLIMAPALQAIDSQLQVFNDVHKVLHHQGYQRDVYSVDIEKMMSICPPQYRNNPTEMKKWLDDQMVNIKTSLKSIDPDSDIVLTNDITRNQGQNSSVSRSVDFRAINELTDIQTLNGLKQLSTFANRHSGRTETYSSVEMKIFVQGILSLQRGSKRFVEEIMRMWLRVKGIQAIPVFTHNVVDWQSEMDKIDVALKKGQHYAIAQLMNWINADYAANAVFGVEKAISPTPSENVRASFSNQESKIKSTKEGDEEE